MNTARTAGTLGLGTTLIAALGVAGGPAAFADGGCRTGALPAVVVGDPGVHAQDALGVYLWHGAHGYSLRVTHPGKDRVVVSGVVTVTRDVSRLRKVALEKGDRVALDGSGHRLAFRFANDGAVDGLDFAADCSKAVRVQLRIDGRPATAAQVFLGKDRTAPTSLPVVIRRTPAQTPTPTPTPTATPAPAAPAAT